MITGKGSNTGQFQRIAFCGAFALLIALLSSSFLYRLWLPDSTLLTFSLPVDVSDALISAEIGQVDVFAEGPDGRELLGTGYVLQRLNVKRPERPVQRLILRTFGRPSAFILDRVIEVNGHLGLAKRLGIQSVQPLNRFTRVESPTAGSDGWIVTGQEDGIEREVLVEMASPLTPANPVWPILLTALALFSITMILTYLLLLRWSREPPQEASDAGKPLLTERKWFVTILFCVFLAASFHASGVVRPDALHLDYAWQMALEYGTANRLPFGQDIVFTYGPLGFANLPAGLGLLSTAHQVLDLLLALAVAAAGTFLATRFRGPLLVMFILAVLPMMLHMEQRLFLVIYGIILAILVSADSPLTRRRTAMLLSATSLLALLSLIKMTYLLFSVFTLCMAISYLLWKRHGLVATLLLPAYALSLVVLWMLSGQQIGDFAAFLHSSFSWVEYYRDMAQPTSWAVLGCAAGGALLLSLLVLGDLRKTHLPAQVVMAVVAAGAVYLSWRHAFLRVDQPHLEHLVMQLPVAGLVALAALGARQRQSLQEWASALTIGVILLLSQFIIPWHTFSSPTLAWFQAMTKFSAKPAELSRGWDRPAPLEKEGDLPAADVFHYQIDGVLKHPKLRYQPRPSLQSYPPGTLLQEKNLESFLAPESRPDLIQYQLNSIDGRWNSQEDALLLPTLYAGTELVNWDPRQHAGLLLKSTPGAMKALEPVQVAQLSARFGQPVDLSPYADQPLLLRVELREKSIGKILSTLIKPPILQIRLTAQNGAAGSFSLMAAQAPESPFLVSPMFITETDLAAWYREHPLPASRRVAAVSISPKRQWVKLYEPDFELVVYALPDFRPGAAKPPQNSPKDL